jgi:hypothetical protein
MIGFAQLVLGPIYHLLHHLLATTSRFFVVECGLQVHKMTSSYVFDGKIIRELRNRVASWWMKRVVIDGPDGWSRCELNPMVLLGFFYPLRLKSGYVLRAYQYRNCASGYGMVWALPTDAEFPEPAPTSPGEPPKPAGALDDPLQVVYGDGSPWSYLCASLFARELGDFAGFGSGLTWSTHLVLDGDPWNNKNNFAHALAGQGFSDNPLGWHWHGSRPRDWRPAVMIGDGATCVRFYTFTGFGQQRINYFEDLYRPDSLVFKRSETIIAAGPQGIPW